MPDPRYPIGRFEAPAAYTRELRARFIREVGRAPEALERAVSGLTEQELDTPYREGGWTIRQVVHHVADSHMNAYVRFKLAVTEETPTIKPYHEARWAELEDAARAEITGSLALIAALHGRWVRFLRSLDEAQFGRKFNHPDIGVVTLDWALALYAWHGRHHVAHITSWRERATG
jgi:uncharacterized damage-inducible protein DinB